MGARNCLKCNGLLQAEDDEWRCLLCGRYYYPQPPLNYVPERNLQRNYNPVVPQDLSPTPRDINSLLELLSKSWYHNNN